MAIIRSSLVRGAVALFTLGLWSNETHADSSVPVIWLAAGARNAPCAGPQQCAVDAGLACIGDTCLDAGELTESCRPAGHPLGSGCDLGLACDETECVPAGGVNQLCRPCGSNESCVADRCDWGLGCNLTSFTCEPAGARNQPCREDRENPLTGQSIAACDGALECLMGKCLAAEEENQPCGAAKACAEGLFCWADGSERGKCVATPVGLVSQTTTKQASSCVRNVREQFTGIKRWGDSYGATFSFDAREGDRLPPENARIADYDGEGFQDGTYSPNRDHVQGIIELSPGRYLHTRANDDGDPAGLVISDRSRSLLFYPTQREPIWSEHPGGLSSFGNTIAVAVEHGRRRLSCDQAPAGFHCEGTYLHNNNGWVDFWEYDASNPANPLAHKSQFSTHHLDGDGTSPSAVAVTRTPDGKKLLFMTGQGTREAWLLQENSYASYTQLAHFPNLEHGLPGWRQWQNVHFVTQCDGSLYLVASAGEVKARDRKSENWVDVWQVKASKRGVYSLVYVDGFEPKYDDTRCQTRYAGNPVVRDGFLRYLCGTGLSSIADSNNIGMAEFWAINEPNWSPDDKEIGEQCCEHDIAGKECLTPPKNGACP